ncbi:hypothetical protein RmaAA213_22260 [Rhodothermus marinus]|nr:hypothetical protein RmaAA213_22260 [Rhodothermus marinus]BBM73367.1 hypothetical protein RmaAA338_22320 [Rhodothermus marinus]
MGVMAAMLRALAEDLKARGKLDLEECFIDGTFVVAKKGAMRWERPSGAKLRWSWQWQRRWYSYRRMRHKCSPARSEAGQGRRWRPALRRDCPGG